MKANQRFLGQPKHFWANVRSISQHIGYTERGTGRIKVPSLAEVADALDDLGLLHSHVLQNSEEPTPFGLNLLAYFEYRAETLNEIVRPLLMNATKARRLFMRLKRTLRPRCPLPMNKQKGDKKAEAYFSGIINMLIEANSKGWPCDYNPMELTAITSQGVPLRTLARRVDGAFPSTLNPVAVWEIKEYYYTTTFGSRVADGVYESLLDGMELEELREHETVDVKHYLLVDDYNTWWNMGRSYLCRIVDMLHMGYIDEALFGAEVVDRLPAIVKEWVRIARQREGR
ncbi:MAG: hypothetical protein HYX73_00590 [Acidobacteria bacterium]|nr:hypothetical protein [Acidobacteriota bacterium]